MKGICKIDKNLAWDSGIPNPKWRLAQVSEPAPIASIRPNAISPSYSLLVLRLKEPHCEYVTPRHNGRAIQALVVLPVSRHMFFGHSEDYSGLPVTPPQLAPTSSDTRKSPLAPSVCMANRDPNSTVQSRDRFVGLFQ
jgi:hypothetical protein